MWWNILSNRAELDISVFRTDATFRITWGELDSSSPLLKTCEQLFKYWRTNIPITYLAKMRYIRPNVKS